MQLAAFFNAFLFVFNMMPIPPLDGAHIIGAFMNDDTRAQWRKLDQYGIFIIIGLVIFAGPSFGSFLFQIVTNVINMIVDLLQVVGL